MQMDPQTKNKHNQRNVLNRFDQREVKHFDETNCTLNDRSFACWKNQRCERSLCR